LKYAMAEAVQELRDKEMAAAAGGGNVA
jgi:hypothetical protein